MGAKKTKMSATDQKAVASGKNTLSQKMSSAQKILNATKNAGGVGVLATYNRLGCFDGVRVNIPSLSAKYMTLVSAHTIGAPEADLENSHQVNLLEVPEHFRHGDMMRRLKDGSTKPAVIRHFFVPSEKCGQIMVAMIEIQKKISLVNGEETIILNIWERKDIVATSELRIGTTHIGKGHEFPVPGQENRVIAIRLIEQKVRPEKNEAAPCPEKKSGLEIAVPATPAKTISQTQTKTSGVKKIVLGNGKKKFVLQR